jgi:Flp pilus assembly protein TadG
MRQLSPTAHGAIRSRRGARGVAFLWFLLIGMPLMFFGTAMGVDFTRIVLGHREVATATHAAALAAAYQFTPGEATIDKDAAHAAAVETMCTASRERVMHVATPPTEAPSCVGGGQVSVTTRFPTVSSVEVTSQYHVAGLLLMSYFGYGDSVQSVTRTAAVCDPRNASGPTGGNCARPTS